MEINFKATKYAFVISIVCFLLTWTMVVPIISILPGAYLEFLLRQKLDDVPYKTLVGYCILCLFLVLVITMLVYLLVIRLNIKRQSNFNNSFLVIFLLFQLLIIHPLVFYIWAYSNSGRAGDGQFVLGVIETFPYSSLLFIPLGLSIDFVKNKMIRKAVSSSLPDKNINGL